MNPDPSKLRQQQQQVQQSEASLEQTQGQHEFDSVEGIIRYDAHNTPLPGEVTERLKESIAAEPPPPRSWWQRLFGTRT